MPSKSRDFAPIVLLVGGGSKLPAVIKASKAPNAKFKISLVVTHKKNSPGIDLALKYNIPAIYFNLPDFRTRLVKNHNQARQKYAKTLGWFISQREYCPKLLVFAGWDLILGHDFFDFFKSPIGDGYKAINLHPAIMPITAENQFILSKKTPAFIPWESITLPDGTKTPAIKGEQQVVLATVLKQKLTYFGPTVHFMNPKKFDTGKVVNRAFIKVGSAKTVEELRKKLMPVEDKILIEAINTVIRDI